MLLKAYGVGECALNAKLHMCPITPPPITPPAEYLPISPFLFPALPGVWLDFEYHVPRRVSFPRT